MLPATFSMERAVTCFHLAIGKAWKEVLPSTIEQAIALQTPSIGAVRKYTDDEATAQMLAEIITQTSLLMNVGKNLRSEQVLPICEIILQTPEYRIFTLADFRLALIRGVQGKYGATYDRLDLTVISSWLDKYWSERMEYAEANSAAYQNKEMKAPESETAIPMPDYVRESVERYLQGLKAFETPFEPDEFILRQWQEEWLNMPKDQKDGYRTFDVFKRMQTEKMKKR